MTIDALPRDSRRTRTATDPETLPIGEQDANIFDCPACRRPLAKGTSRCPSCRTRLLGGVRATRAAGFIAVGLIVGSLVGGGGVAGLSLLTTRPLPAGMDTGAGPVPATSSAPVVSAPPVASAPPMPGPAIPATASSALRQSSVINQRVAAEATRLRTALALASPVASDLARSLRTLAGHAAIGDRLAPDVADWSEGAAVSAALAEFYSAIGATAHEGLSASISNRDAYVDAARQMLALIDGLPALDAELRGLAASVDLELPPLTVGRDGAP